MIFLIVKKNVKEIKANVWDMNSSKANLAVPAAFVLYTLKWAIFLMVMKMHFVKQRYDINLN